MSFILSYLTVFAALGSLVLITAALSKLGEWIYDSLPFEGTAWGFTVGVAVTAIPITLLTLTAK
jgi:hypothetical protein